MACQTQPLPSPWAHIELACMPAKLDSTLKDHLEISSMHVLESVLCCPEVKCPQCLEEAGFDRWWLP